MNHFSESFIENILNSIADPVFVKDKDRRFVLVNQAFEKFIGYSKEELFGKTDYDFFPDEQSNVFKERDQQVFETGEENVNEEKVTVANGDLHIISTKKKIVKDNEGNKFLVGVIHDITEKKKLLDAYQKSNMMLQNYAHMVSHELKSPLRTILSFSNLLVEYKSDNLRLDQKKHLGFISESAKGMNDLVMNLLQFSVVSNQKIDIQLVDANELVEEVVNEMALEIKATNCDLKIGKLPKSIHMDRGLVKQIFQNLIVNALKFKLADRIQVISIDSYLEEDSYVFSVKDNGIGIEKKYADRIFKMFTRLHNSNEYEGSGIGLAICSLIASYHKGKIWVESKINEGSDFKFSISRSLD